MRNPFARLATRDTARPSLRDRAAALKASASRVIRRKPVDAAPVLAAEPVAPDAVSPALAALVSEWSAMLAHENAEGSAGRDVSAEGYRKRVALHRAILSHPARSLADLAAKAPIFREEADNEASPAGSVETLPFLAWQCVLRDLSTLTAARPAVAADPIFAAIAETRRLTQARAIAADLPQPEGSIDPLPEQNAATDAFFAHVDGVLLKTVPTTAAGCVALARFAVEFLADEGWVLDEQDGNEHTRILDLIARSPMLDKAPTDRPFAPDFSGMSANALMRTYAALKMASDIMGLSTWAVQGEIGGNRILDAENDRLSFFQNDITDELARRGQPDNRGEAARRCDALIDRALACGEYDEVARLASEANAKGL
ncbi:hypothetical protein ASF41_21665 [Methylobacterium sp. Leaf111]|uniref:hypothetical protein n=1 Tax=Methylobacterium sp. Leaf111 TaxID=1736257 RepID=UPI0006FA4B9A|nr:hypothetical protein [Methylobacterium sp. Leaf111]KQP67677.1 hypothetical protein ASF41_21665 [Methylobacterium sp. Leaf111]